MLIEEFFISDKVYSGIFIYFDLIINFKCVYLLTRRGRGGVWREREGNF